jgi:hypothetical protein
VIVVTDPAWHAPHEPVMAYLRDADGGEMMLMADTRETTCRDPGVVKRLLAAAPGSTVNGSDVPAPEAPQISKDSAADNADVYALVRPDRPDTVTLISNFVPLQEPSRREALRVRRQNWQQIKLGGEVCATIGAGRRGRLNGEYDVDEKAARPSQTGPDTESCICAVGQDCCTGRTASRRRRVSRSRDRGRGRSAQTSTEALQTIFSGSSTFWVGYAVTGPALSLPTMR